MTEMQKQFEEWASSEGLPTTYLDKHKFYESHVTDMAWRAWQASRAVIVVKLPEYEFCNHHRNILIDEVKTALDAAGVSYE